MKACSVGLEAEVYRLSEEEVNLLGEKSLSGILKFYEVNSDEKREIPFQISVKPRQKDFVRVFIQPRETYFGQAEKLYFSINQEYYGELKEFGIAEGARFLGVGKLKHAKEGYNRFIN